MRRFLYHYAEMVAAMFLGMFALGMPADWFERTVGLSSSGGHHPTTMFVTMAATMTVPMVAWMRVRGHGWRVSLEMAASMVLPTVVVLGLLWTGVAGGVGVLMVAEHVAMLTCMLVAMVIRWDEYAGAGHAHGAAQPALAA
jgi:hypothetical protein